ncbi:hypothetical protein M6B38_250355 [Iris pallida]|uniref:Uncharacterized protein n=1 Tax=Iris pallida TaxID=29817 RepID=A0AAX6IJ90_IRIPA|nr:hypothetical protein M6B38_250355 [Iris pallida]
MGTFGWTIWRIDRCSTPFRTIEPEFQIFQSDSRAHVRLLGAVPRSRLIFFLQGRGRNAVQFCTSGALRVYCRGDVSIDHC